MSPTPRPWPLRGPPAHKKLLVGLVPGEMAVRADDCPTRREPGLEVG
jgi:hypothetical protein